MQRTLSITTPAPSHALVSLEEFKRGLKITSTTEDPMLTDIIAQSSDAIARYCNRVFGQEEVIETFRNVPSDLSRLPLARWPVVAITSVVSGGVTLTEDVDFEVDGASGTLINLTGNSWGEPVVVDYTGGYLLPDQSPPSLRQAITLLGRENYNAAQRGDSTVRMISHKESRIIYFDPNAANKASAVAAGGTAAQRAIRDLLGHFTRYEV